MHTVSNGEINDPTFIDYLDEVTLVVRAPVETAMNALRLTTEIPHPAGPTTSAAIDTLYAAVESWKRIDEKFQANRPRRNLNGEDENGR